MLNFLIIVVAILLVLYALRRWKKQKITNDVGEMMEKVMVAWAAQGPFRTGAESSRAMRYGFLAVIGVDATKNFEETIVAHENAFNANPSHWNSLVPVQRGFS